MTEYNTVSVDRFWNFTFSFVLAMKVEIRFTEIIDQLTAYWAFFFTWNHFSKISKMEILIYELFRMLEGA